MINSIYRSGAGVNSTNSSGLSYINQNNYKGFDYISSKTLSGNKEISSQLSRLYIAFLGDINKDEPIVSEKPESISNLNLYRSNSDAIVVKNNHVNVQHNRVSNNTYHNDGHIDGVQLIPNNQYAAGRLDHIKIQANHFSSRHGGNMQPIFASDGVFGDVYIKDNILETSAKNVITINGLLTGHVSGNKDENNETVNIVLNPIRLGGDNNVLVLSSTTAAYQYGLVTGDVTDKRRDPKAFGRANVIAVEDFPMSDFQGRYFALKNQMEHSSSGTLSGSQQAQLARRAFDSMIQDGTCRLQNRQLISAVDPQQKDGKCTYQINPYRFR